MKIRNVLHKLSREIEVEKPKLGPRCGDCVISDPPTLSEKTPCEAVPASLRVAAVYLLP